MIQLDQSVYFILLLIIPFIWLLSYVKQKNQDKQISAWGDKNVVVQNIHTLPAKFRLKSVLFFVGMLFSILALVNPQFGKRTQKVRSSSSEIILALDLSESMLAEDVLPSRLSRAQLWISQFVERFPSEKVGLISFAGNAHLQSPLTTDISTIKLMSSLAHPSSISTQGTSLSAAIELATKSFSTQSGNHRILILISDGEDHEGEALEAAAAALRKGIHVFTVPIGTDEGAKIPQLVQGMGKYKTSANGEQIITKPNRKLLREIASKGEGQMLDISSGEAVFDILKNEFSKIAKKDIAMQSFDDYESYFQYLLIFGIILFGIEICIGRKK